MGNICNNCHEEFLEEVTGNNYWDGLSSIDLCNECAEKILGRKSEI